MPPPCRHPDPEATRDTCSLCRVYLTHEGYRAAWDGEPPPPDPAAVPYEHWPLTARLVAKLRTPEDRGLGDTIARHLDRFGADGLKRLFRRLTGKDCGCAARQQKLNRFYPYVD